MDHEVPSSNLCLGLRLCLFLFSSSKSFRRCNATHFPMKWMPRASLIWASRKLVYEKTSKLRFLDILSTGGINLKHMLSHSRTHTHTYTPSLSHTHPSIHTLTQTQPHTRTSGFNIGIHQTKLKRWRTYFQSSQKWAQCEVCTGS